MVECQRKGLIAMCRRIPQEGLKLIACITMLLDHFGAIVVVSLFQRNPSAMLAELYDMLRIIGRLAFPIYCFLLSEGSFHTKNPLRYGLRLALCAVISELPYDFALRGCVDWAHQNVMITLFLGFCAMELMKKGSNIPWKLAAAIPFLIAAQCLKSDYGANGVALIVLFSLTRDFPHKWVIQILGMWFIFSPGHAMMLNWINHFSVTKQELCILALIPISMYSGQKLTSNRAVQWGFYLFYPLHLLVLMILK